MTEPRREGSGGILESARQLAATAIGLVHTRIEIIATELEEERVRLGRLLLLAVVAGFALAVAALLAVVFLVVVFWDTHRLVAIGVLFLVFIAVGMGCVWRLVHDARSRPKLFATTLGELAKDGERLHKAP